MSVNTSDSENVPPLDRVLKDKSFQPIKQLFVSFDLRSFGQ